MEVIEHEHPLNLIDLLAEQSQYIEEHDEEEDEDDDVITKQEFRCPCHRCGLEINSYHRYYYKCANSCDYSLHIFCAKLPKMLKHPSHRSHALFLLFGENYWIRIKLKCKVCQTYSVPGEIGYFCIDACRVFVHVNCVVGMEDKKIHHPSHPHPLVSTPNQILSKCDACGKEHKGIFYFCTTCSGFFIHTDCVFLPKKVLVQQTTDDVFYHTHALTLSYSFPIEDQKDKFNPRCRICGDRFDDENLWIYKCEKCRYYAHVDCATSRKERFMSILSSAGLGRTYKNFKDDDHPDLLHLPFHDQTYSILKHRFLKEVGSRTFAIDEKNLKHTSHEHLLVLVDTQCNDITGATSSRINSLSCHNPMKKIELLCNGCIRPITSMPFYKCDNEDQCCNFVLHEWCTRLPTEIKNHPGHLRHTLFLLPNVPRRFFKVFYCYICNLPCNGFVYACVQCDYFIDVSCGFIPNKITHEAHPNHLLSRVCTKEFTFCSLCAKDIYTYNFSFNCHSCDFYLHPACALLLPRTIRHRYDKHPMKLSYFPIENHKNEYFCEICEDILDPQRCFYHCNECVQSMHSHCAPFVLQSEKACSSSYHGVHHYANMKYGGIYNNERLHPHPLVFVQGTTSDGDCAARCGCPWYDGKIFKCAQCKYVIHYRCVVEK